MKRIFLLLLLATSTRATTYTAASCSAADVQAKINLTVAGDTVLVPGGTCTWNPGTGNNNIGTVNISASHQITFDGQGTTTINWAGDGTDPGFQNTAFSVTAGSASSTFIKGFTFNGHYINGRSPITLTSTSGNLTFRITGNTFKAVASAQQGTMLLVNSCGNTPGLIDHNTFTASHNSEEIIHLFGCNSQILDWSSDVVPGTGNFIFLENNTFNGPVQALSVSTQAIESYHGARYVFRYNTLNNVDADAHGSTSGTGVNCFEVNTRWYEIYNNSLTVTTGNNIPTFNYRGGSGVFFGNVQTGSSGGKIQLQADCLSASSGVAYPYQDQDGRGITTSSGSSTTNSSPIYIWGNTNFYVGTLGHDGNPTTYIQLNRDYFVSASQPTTLTRCESAADVAAGCPVSYSYAPYTYPHPLAGGTAVSLSPNPVAFGNQSVSSNTNITVTLQNTGSVAEVLSSNPVVFSGAGFSQFATTCTPSLSIAPAGTCTVTVRFTPTALATFNGTLTINGTLNASTTLSGTGVGTTRTAASCSTADVQAAITASSTGDTVLVPGPCSLTWSSFVTIPATKGITVQAVNSVVLSNTSQGFILDAGASTTRISGFTCNSAGNVPVDYDGHCLQINTAPGNATYRIDHNTFCSGGGSCTTAQTIFTTISGIGPGLWDHNTLTGNGSSFIQENGTGSNQTNTSGWTSDVVPGGSNMLFFEDNVFSNSACTSSCGESSNGWIQGVGGTRTVIRHNIFNMLAIDQHGSQGGGTNECPGGGSACTGNVGVRWYEIYNNTFVVCSGCSWFSYADLRAGSGVLFNNTITGSNGGFGFFRFWEENSLAWPQAYQVGSGLGDITSPHASCASGTQNTSPVYVWQGTGSPINATGPDSPTSFNIKLDSGVPSSVGRVQLNRDIFVSVSQPATLRRIQASGDTCSTTYVYSPFTYPHPLVGGGTGPPVPPTSLTSTPH